MAWKFPLWCSFPLVRLLSLTIYLIHANSQYTEIQVLANTGIYQTAKLLFYHLLYLEGNLLARTYLTIVKSWDFHNIFNFCAYKATSGGPLQIFMGEGKHSFILHFLYPLQDWQVERPLIT